MEFVGVYLLERLLFRFFLFPTSLFIFYYLPSRTLQSIQYAIPSTHSVEYKQAKTNTDKPHPSNPFHSPPSHFRQP